ncbi:MAG: carboxypeptidase regulatory-like domain-containing protein [Bacteroidota bacterium]
MKLLQLLLLLGLVFPTYGVGQIATQTIKGKVVDANSRTPLVGAVVIVPNSDPPIGAITDDLGNFRLEAVPLGRRAVQVQYPGYAAYLSPELILNSVRERYLEVKLLESIGESTTEEVLITTNDFPTGAVNELSVVSTRSFSPEETDRYAASVNDPGRLALSFPGVQQGGDDAENDIIIRGNSSFGVLWRLEGIDIPNPNHFARPGTSGGGVTVFSAQLLSRSDFSSGGMPAEYGNALSGAFDVHFRKGNMDSRQYRFKAGLLGLDFSTEGPIQRGRSSYLVNYRYSTLSLLNRAGFQLVGERVDNDFQDLSFNLAFDGKDGKSFTTVFGMAGPSLERYRPVDVPEDRDPGRTDHWEDRYRANTMAAIGVTHTRILDDKSFLKFVVAGMNGSINYEYDTLDLSNKRYRYNTERYLDRRIAASVTYSRKFSSRTRLKTGIQAHQVFFTFYRESAPRRLTNITTGDVFRDISVDGEGNTQTFQAYAQLTHFLTEKIQMNVGGNFFMLGLNQTMAVDPRISFRYKINRRQNLSLAYGIHSQHLPLGAYFYSRSDTAQDGSVQINNPNFNLPLIRSHHLIAGYHYTLGKNIRIGADVYFQRLFQVPVEDDPTNTSTWWMLNNQSGIAQFPMVSDGKGINYGVDVSLEKFFSQQIFFLLTASRFESQYVLGDGRTFNTRFATEYATSTTIGKEFTFKKGGVLQAGFRVLYNGGFRYTPPKQPESQEEGRFIGDEANAWSAQVGPYYRIDSRISYRRNRPKFAWILSLDIQNVLDRRNNRSIGYDAINDTIFFRNHGSGLIPVLSYQIDF